MNDTLIIRLVFIAGLILGTLFFGGLWLTVKRLVASTRPALLVLGLSLIHILPPPLTKRSTKSEVFITGIKAIDVLMPLERGGKAGLFGGAGVGKTILLTEMIHNMVGYNLSLIHI